MNCLNCKTELEQIKGKREKKFCNSTCRSNFWQKEQVKNRKLERIILKQEIKKTSNDLMNLGVAVTKTTKEGIKSISPLSEEGAAVMSEYELRMDKERIEVLKKEIANPPQTKYIPIKKYIAVRQQELNELLSKIK